MTWILLLSLLVNVVVGARYVLLRRAVREYAAIFVAHAPRNGSPPLRIVVGNERPRL